MDKCCFPKKDTTDMLISQLRREIEELARNDEKLQAEISERLLTQDGKIAEVCNHIKDNLSATICELMNTMEFTGEIDGLITKAINGIIASGLYYESVDNTDPGVLDVYENISVKTVRNDKLGVSYIVTKVKKSLKPFVNFTNGTDQDAYSYNKSVIDYMKNTSKPLAINAGLRGVTVKNGISHIENNVDSYEGFFILCIDDKGELKAVPRNTTATEIINMGYRDAINIWSPIVENGYKFNALSLDTTHEDYDYIFIQKHPRQVLGTLPDGSYIIITIDGRMVKENGVDFAGLVEIVQNEGCVNAYNLDGGASTQTVIGKRLINRLLSESRAIGTVITFESEVGNYDRRIY